MVKVLRRFRGESVCSIVCPGSTIGERAAFVQGPRGFSAETLNECTLVEIRSSDFVRAASEWPDLWMWIARHLVQRAADLERRIHSMVNLRVEQRILCMLADLAECAGAHFTTIRLPLTQLDVAMLVGATRETTSTTLNQLERKGLLRLGRAVVEVPSPDNLRKAAELL